MLQFKTRKNLTLTQKTVLRMVSAVQSPGIFNLPCNIVYQQCGILDNTTTWKSTSIYPQRTHIYVRAPRYWSLEQDEKRECRHL